MSIETQLREALSARADEVGAPTLDPYARVSGAIAVSRRRRRTAAVAGVAALAALAVAIPSLGELGRDTTTPAKKTTVVVPGPQDPRWGSMASWPTRGSLANDAAFLDQVRERTLVKQVLYAGDVGTGRVVVLWAPDEAGNEFGRVSLQQGSRGATADQLAETASGTPRSPGSIAVLVGTARDTTALLLAAPGVRTASLSATVTINTDGTVSRSWQPVALVGGAGVVETGSAPLATRVRLGTSDGAPDLIGVQPITTDGASICLSCSGDDFRTKAVAATSDSVAMILGLDPADVQTTAVYYGPVDPRVAAATVSSPPKGATGKTTLFVADSRLPEGQVLRSALVLTNWSDGSAESSELATAVPIDAATAAQRPFVLVYPQEDATATLYEVFAPGAASVQLLGDLTSSDDTARKQLVNGTATFSLAETGVSDHRQVVVQDHAGRESGPWPLSLPSDPFDGGAPTLETPIAPFTSAP